MVIDASVLTDMFLTDSPRHHNALELVKFIQSNNIIVTIPMHAVLELKCAIANVKLNSGSGDLTAFFSESSPLPINTVPIDNNFFHEYMDITVPYLKAGDLPYILVAKKKNIPLITEDEKQYRVAKQSGVNVFTIKEFIDQFQLLHTTETIK